MIISFIFYALFLAYLEYFHGVCILFLSSLFVIIGTTHKMCAHLNYSCLVMLKGRFIVHAERLYLFLYFVHLISISLNI